MTAMRKILAFTLCLAMLLSMNAAAFATEHTHIFSNGSCSCGEVDPNYGAAPTGESGDGTEPDTGTVPEPKAKAVSDKPFSVNGTYFDTLEGAYNNAPDNAEILMHKSVEGPGLVIKKPIVINLQGNTYTFNKGVGSTGTESNGLQILKESGSVILKNGTFNVAESVKNEFYILIQNYANLTVDRESLRACL